MLTEQARQILSKLIDANWELEQATNSVIREALDDLCRKLRTELIDEMGEEEYDRFMEQARQMFS